jgi:hypothetical protein
MVEILEDLINSKGWELVKKRLIENYKASRNALCVFKGGEKQNEKDDIFEKGQQAALLTAINLPDTIIKNLKE